MLQAYKRNRVFVCWLCFLVKKYNYTMYNSDFTSIPTSTHGKVMCLRKNQDFYVVCSKTKTKLVLEIGKRDNGNRE